MQNTIKFTVDLTHKDYRIASLYNNFMRDKKMSVLAILVFLIGIAILCFASANLSGILLGIAFILYPLLMIGLNLFRSEQVIKGRKIPAHTELKGEFHDDGFNVIQKGEQTQFTWNSIRYFVKIGKYMFVYVGNRKMINIPLRELSYEQANKIVQLIVNHVPGKRRKIY